MPSPYFSAVFVCGSGFQQLNFAFPLPSHSTLEKGEPPNPASSTNQQERRLVLKSGRPNVRRSNGPKSATLSQIFVDLFHSVVDSKWRYTLASFTSTYFVSWLIFALLWWTLALVHGDLDPEHLPEHQTANDWTPCVWNITGFTSCFLFSIEVSMRDLCWKAPPMVMISIGMMSSFPQPLEN
jgi:hypothetical protein